MRKCFCIYIYRYMWGEEHGVECMSSCPSVVLGPLLATPHDMTWQHRLCEMFAGKYLFRGICLHNKTPQFATRVRCCLLCIYMPAIDRSLTDCRYVGEPPKEMYELLVSTLVHG